MKKVINGKMYNTETAEYIGNNWYSSPGQFDHVNEDLYRKRTGEFFLHGEGGPLTDWAEVCNDGAYAGSGIKPLTTDEAKQWAEKHLDADSYVDLFGAVEE